MNRDEFEHEATADAFEVVDVSEAGIDISVPALSDDDTYEAAIAEHEEEEEEVARPNRGIIRRAKRAARKHGAGYTRAFRKGRMPENQAHQPAEEEHEHGAD